MTQTSCFTQTHSGSSHSNDSLPAGQQTLTQPTMAKGETTAHAQSRAAAGRRASYMGTTMLYPPHNSEYKDCDFKNMSSGKCTIKALARVLVSRLLLPHVSQRSCALKVNVSRSQRKGMNKREYRIKACYRGGTMFAQKTVTKAGRKINFFVHRPNGLGKLKCYQPLSGLALFLSRGVKQICQPPAYFASIWLMVGTCFVPWP